MTDCITQIPSLFASSIHKVIISGFVSKSNEVSSIGYINYCNFFLVRCYSPLVHHGGKDSYFWDCLTLPVAGIKAGWWDRCNFLLGTSQNVPAQGIICEGSWSSLAAQQIIKNVGDHFSQLPHVALSDDGGWLSVIPCHIWINVWKWFKILNPSGEKLRYFFCKRHVKRVEIKYTVQSAVQQ